MFLAALFTIAKTWKRPKCPSTDEWIKKLWYIYTKEYSVQFSSVQSLSRVWLFATTWTTAHQASLFITNSWSQTKLMFIECDAIQTCYALSSPSPPALNLSQHQGLFKWVSSLHQVSKVLVFQLQHQCFQRTCYSAIKRNAFESVLMRWVNLEPIIQSEGSQKEI